MEQLERIVAGDNALACGLELFNYACKDSKTGVNGHVEAILLKGDNLKNIFASLNERGICILVL